MLSRAGASVRRESAVAARNRLGPEGPADSEGKAVGRDDRLAELERAYARLARFAGTAAHELSEPLVAMELYSALLLERLESGLDAQSRADLQALSRNAARLRMTVDTLLNEARSSARAPSREPVALSDVVLESVRLLTHEISAREARLVIRPLPVVHGDPALLGTVVKNLLSNALRYGPRRGAAIRIGASHTPSGWRVFVVSQGKTILREDQARIFAPFERGRDERRSEGTGLGLAISRRIVERQGGVIGVEPCSRGNRFYFTIPD
jgi:signal transduction histidine kinase